MRKLKPIIFVFTSVLLLTPACKDRQKSLADRRKDETHAINRFIEKNGLVIVTQFPKDGKFRDNEFYKDPNTGVYFNIVEPGSDQKIEFKEEVYIRFSGLQYIMTEDTTQFSNLRNSTPETITYLGPVNRSNVGSYNVPGWVVPLEHIGHGAKIKMIIPFEMGSSYERSNFQPTYYDAVHYRFKSQKNVY